MKILVNGTPQDVPEGTTVAALLDGMQANRPGVAVALHGEVVPRAAWPTTVLPAEAAIEVLVAVQGG